MRYNKRIKKAYGGISTPHRGKLDYLGNNLYNIFGPSHANDGVDIDKGNIKIEAEGGEVLQDMSDGIRIFSKQPMINGVSPASLVRSGVNPNAVFNAQQTINAKNHRGDFANMKNGGIRTLFDDIISNRKRYATGGGKPNKIQGYMTSPDTAIATLPEIEVVAPRKPITVDEFNEWNDRQKVNAENERWAIAEQRRRDAARERLNIQRKNDKAFSAGIAGLIGAPIVAASNPELLAKGIVEGGKELGKGLGLDAIAKASAYKVGPSLARLAGLTLGGETGVKLANEVVDNTDTPDWLKNYVLRPLANLSGAALGGGLGYGAGAGTYNAARNYVKNSARSNKLFSGFDPIMFTKDPNMFTDDDIVRPVLPENINSEEFYNFPLSNNYEIKTVSPGTSVVTKDGQIMAMASTEAGQRLINDNSVIYRPPVNTAEDKIFAKLKAKEDKIAARAEKVFKKSEDKNSNRFTGKDIYIENKNRQIFNKRAFNKLIDNGYDPNDFTSFRYRGRKYYSPKEKIQIGKDKTFVPKSTPIENSANSVVDRTIQERFRRSQGRFRREWNKARPFNPVNYKGLSTGRKLLRGTKDAKRWVLIPGAIGSEFITGGKFPFNLTKQVEQTPADTPFNNIYAEPYNEVLDASILDDFGENFSDSIYENPKVFIPDEEFSSDYKYGGRVKSKCGGRYKARNGYQYIIDNFDDDEDDRTAYLHMFDVNPNNSQSVSPQEKITVPYEPNKQTNNNLDYLNIWGANPNDTQPVNLQKETPPLYNPNKQTNNNLDYDLLDNTKQNIENAISGMTANNYLSFGINTLGNIGTALFNEHSIHKYHSPKRPISTPYIPNLVRYNIGSKLAEVINSVAKNITSTTKNTASGQNLRNSLNAINDAASLARNELYTDRFNKETEGINTNRGLLRANVAANIDKYNDWRDRLTQFKNDQITLRNKNVIGAINNITENFGQTLKNNDEIIKFYNTLDNDLARSYLSGSNSTQALLDVLPMIGYNPVNIFRKNKKNK